MKYPIFIECMNGKIYGNQKGEVAQIIRDFNSITNTRRRKKRFATFATLLKMRVFVTLDTKEKSFQFGQRKYSRHIQSKLHLIIIDNERYKRH